MWWKTSGRRVWPLMMMSQTSACQVENASGQSISDFSGSNAVKASCGLNYNTGVGHDLIDLCQKGNWVQSFDRDKMMERKRQEKDKVTNSKPKSIPWALFQGPHLECAFAISPVLLLASPTLGLNGQCINELQLVLTPQPWLLHSKMVGPSPT